MLLLHGDMVFRELFTHLFYKISLLPFLVKNLSHFLHMYFRRGEEETPQLMPY